MENIEQTDIETLKKQALFNEFTDDQLQTILNLTEKKKYDADETITREGEETAEIYFIAEGEVRILKLDEEGIFNLALGKLQAGDMFGEMSFIDSSPRSSTIETTKSSTIFELSIDKLDQSLPEMKDIYNKLIRNIALININRLRMSNAVQVKTLRTSLRKFQIKEIWGKLLIVLFLISGGLNFLFQFFKDHLHWMDFDLYTWAYWLVLGLATVFAIKRFHLYKDEYGVSLNNIQKTVYQSLGIVIVGLLLLTIFHYFNGEPPDLKPFGFLWLAGYFVYCCAYEFVGRGVVLSLFKRFFDDPRGWLSIVLSACFLTLIPLTAYLQFENMSVFIYFAFNVILGLIFLVQGNLLGVIFIHFVLGAYARYLQLV